MEILTKLKDSREQLFKELSSYCWSDKIIEHMFLLFSVKVMLLEGVPDLQKPFLLNA